MRTTMLQRCWRLFTLTLLGLSWSMTGAWAAKEQMELVSVKTTAAITLDAVAEESWKKAQELAVELTDTPYKPSNGYNGMQATTVKIRSLYDNEFIYFFIQYNDPTESMQRAPWVKQPDGSWKQLKNPDSTDHDNTYYEDKMALIWDINTKGFPKKGCDIACHMAEEGMVNGIKDKSAGRKFTKAGETLDMWHWKGVRTGPVGQIDDQFMDSTTDPTKNKDWGRKSDVKTGGGYTDNINEAKTGPAFMNSVTNEKTKYFILPETKVPFVDTFKAGDVVPGIMIAPFTGPRADIPVKGVWKDGMWTMEIKRKLVTTGEQAEVQDVQFKDLKQAYYFGISVFDNAQINHLYHKGAIKMTFK